MVLTCGLGPFFLMAMAEANDSESSTTAKAEEPSSPVIKAN